jgi:hypothetical protein
LQQVIDDNAFKTFDLRAISFGKIKVTDPCSEVFS